jgi:hypothetical protein
MMTIVCFVCFSGGAYQHCSHEGLLYCHPNEVSSFISRGAAHNKRRERPLLAKDGTKAEKFSYQSVTHEITRFFYMPQSCGHGTHILLPIRRKACFEDFYHTGKTQRLRPGLNPRTRVPEASMLTTRPPKPS